MSSQMTSEIRRGPPNPDHSSWARYCPNQPGVTNACGAGLERDATAWATRGRIACGDMRPWIRRNHPAAQKCARNYVSAATTSKGDKKLLINCEGEWAQHTAMVTGWANGYKGMSDMVNGYELHRPSIPYPTSETSLSTTSSDSGLMDLHP